MNQMLDAQVDGLYQVGVGRMGDVRNMRSVQA